MLLFARFRCFMQTDQVFLHIPPLAEYITRAKREYHLGKAQISHFAFGEIYHRNVENVALGGICKMALYVIGDSHLSLSTQKPMDIFGSRWNGYVEKLKKGWESRVKEEDTVVLAGDISWAMTPEEAKADFDFIEALPGQKIILKGNHDYWWQTMAKLDAFIAKNEYRTIRFLHNNAYETENFIICGSRGWYTDDRTAPIRGADAAKIVAREVQRISVSLSAGQKLQDAAKARGEEKELLAFLHFPPIFKGYICDEMLQSLR